jgi:PAS domain S-box-containing protein
MRRALQPGTSRAAKPTALAQAFELAPIGLCMTLDRTVMHCNATFARLFGATSRQMIGQSIRIVYPSTSEFEHVGRRALSSMRLTGGHEDDRIMKRFDGSLFWCHVVGRAMDRLDPYREAVWTFEEVPGKGTPITRLTPRERQVAVALVEGMTSKQIAARLSLSPRTIDMHRERLMRKFDVHTTTAMLRRLLAR